MDALFSLILSILLLYVGLEMVSKVSGIRVSSILNLLKRGSFFSGLFISIPYKLLKVWISLKVALTDTVECQNCHQKIDLLGKHTCPKCAFVFFGRRFAKCKNCGHKPRFIQCSCGISVPVPYSHISNFFEKK